MTMTVGMCFPRECPGSAVPEFARRLEAGGVDELWLIEDCFFTTAPPLAAAALATTERLTVGLGILPAVARTAAVTAMEIATLASIAPGRVVGGIGHGIQSWMAQMGAATPSPLTTLDEVISAVRRLLRGETVSVHGREVTLDGVRLEHVPDPVPPVLAGVGGPRSLALAGRIADGVVLGGPSTVPHCRAARQAGQDRESGWQLETFVTMAVAADARDAYREMAPTVAEALDSVGFRHLPFLDELRARHEVDGLDGLVAMPRDWWLQIGAIGTRDDAVEHLALLEAEGVTGAAFFPAPELDLARQQIDDVIAIAAAR
jgi:alkanesulfonate monooxygenase SsuD/methylene tetrahydromethanopterin reductase-like flavin-dependent oxidoreductase (luciferase family)